MLSKLKNRKQEGFTIIEVLIVLAIAGLILLVVFLAVPALQRNSRNTQRNNDVAGILGALNEYVNNNNGKLPSASCADKPAGASSAGKCDFLNNVNTGFYQDYSKISYKVNTAAVSPKGVVDLDTVVLQNYTKCSGTTASGTTPGDVTTTTGATSRSVVALYAVETGSGVSQQCKDL